MTVEEALETLFAMASVQDGYAKKATDPGLKVIHKANAKAQREVAGVIADLRAERDAALARVEKLRHLIPEVLASLDASGCNISLARDLRAALDEDARHG